MAIKKGDVIKVKYEGKFEDGEVFDSTELNGGQPLKFQVGLQQIISGFDKSVVGKEVGEEYEIKIEPVDGYGPVVPDLVKQVPRDQFPAAEEPELGKQVVLRHPEGFQRMATITKVDDENITLDLNHPLAGKTLNFKIKVLETGLEPDPVDSCGCGCGHDHGEAKPDPVDACGCGCGDDHDNQNKGCC